MLFGHARSTVVGSILCILVFLAPTSARCDDYQVQGEIGLSFSPDGWVHELVIEPFTPFDFYVLADLSEDGGDWNLRLFEAALHYAIPVAINEVDVLGATTSSIFGLEPGVLSMLWGTCSVDIPKTGLSPVLRVHAIITDEAGRVLIGVGPMLPGSFEGLGPGWYSCDGNAEFMFDPTASGVHAELSVVTSVAVADGSWGTLKSRFSGEVTQ